MLPLKYRSNTGIFVNRNLFMEIQTNYFKTENISEINNNIVNFRKRIVEFKTSFAEKEKKWQTTKLRRRK